MKFLTTCLLVALATPSLTYAAPSKSTLHSSVGSEGVGGGDIGEVDRLATRAGDQSEMMKSVRAQREALQLKRDRLAAAKVIREGAQKIRIFAALFSSVNYPFSEEFKNRVNWLKTANSLDAVVKTETETTTAAGFRLAAKLKIKSKQVTFVSDPATQMLSMDMNRYNEQKRELKQSSVLATIFHEGLRLQGIEGSTSYPYTKDFALALSDAYSGNSEFWNQVRQSAFFAHCSGEEAHYLTLEKDIATADFSSYHRDETSLNFNFGILKDRAKSCKTQLAQARLLAVLGIQGKSVRDMNEVELEKLAMLQFKECDLEAAMNTADTLTRGGFAYSRYEDALYAAMRVNGAHKQNAQRCSGR